jgi:hypothetical protein
MDRQETAGPSTALRSGRDDNFVGELTERKPLCGSRGAQQVPPLRFGSTAGRDRRDDKGEGGEFY